MLTGHNSEGKTLTTQGLLIGVELEDGTDLKAIMSRMVDSISFMDGVGRVEAEHIGEIGQYASLEEDILNHLTQGEATVKES